MKASKMMTPSDAVKQNIKTFDKALNHTTAEFVRVEWVRWMLNELHAAADADLLINPDRRVAGYTVSGEKEPRP